MMVLASELARWDSWREAKVTQTQARHYPAAE